MHVDEASIAIIGDIHLEFAAQIGDELLEDIKFDRQFNGPIRAMVGGTAAHVARNAVATFDAVRLIGAVGDDGVGEVVVRLLRQLGIVTYARTVPGTPTGVVLNIRARKDARGVRLLLVQKGSNSALSPDDVEALHDVISSSSILHVDGYSMLDEPRGAAIERAFSIARSGRVPVSCDLVPHDIHKHSDFHRLARWLKFADIVFVEARTVRALAGHGWTDQEGTADDAHIAWDLLQAHFPQADAFIQFGVSNISESFVCRAGKSPLQRSNGFARGDDPSGFGDRMAVSDLAEFVRSHRSQQHN